ncbi:serine protease inhibitor 42Dd-like isoform X1 [Pollicipes pollicipes]|uniref:serine protease inhibitor 42Dd-like isoform X1 n=4 Tax=Pollicipes pollicipes TaxID=41117 RepID=UPI0018849315|nr:serine protease inhibitor 42Dd-like isoform X1 [Pollicipes pollicipes]
MNRFWPATLLFAEEDSVGTAWVLLMVAASAGACVPNGLDLRLLKAFTTDLSKNQAIAPFAMSTLMTQVWLGARGDTRHEVATVLDIKTSAGSSFLTCYKSALSDFTCGSGNITNLVFNRMYIKRRFKINSGFKDLLHEYFHAVVNKFSLTGQAAYEINTGVAKATGNRIQNLVSQSALRFKLVLLSAVYFKGLWLTPFDMTVKGPFLTASGNKQVDMMKLFTRVPYVKMSDFDAISLPYTDENYVMLILRPLTRNMAAVSRLKYSLDILDVAVIMQRLRSSSVQITMPRFKIRAGGFLNRTMLQLGIRKVFTREADLSNITDKFLAVGLIIHKVFIEVTEEGTEAAGAGAVTDVLPRPVQFMADRPFFAIVWNRKHKINLFSAYVASP